MQHVAIQQVPSIWRRLFYAALASRELLIARALLASRSASAILAELQASGLPAAGQSAGTDPDRSACLDLMIWSLPAAAARVPWRSDCLVQALAARRWLRRLGYNPHAVIGVRKPGHDAIAAHAWVICEGRVIAGGNVSRFEALVAVASGGAREI